MGRVLSTLSDALLPVVIVRVLGKAEVGLLGGVLLVYQTVALVLATELPSALMYYLPGRPADERRALALQQARLLLGLGVLAALGLGLAGLSGELAPRLTASVFAGESPASLRAGLALLALLAPFPLGDLPSRMLPNLLVIEERSAAAARFAVAKSIGTALSVLVPAGLGMGIEALLLSYSAFGVLQGLVLVYFLRALYPGAARVAAPVTLRTIFGFALPLGATSVVSQLGNRVDRYLVASVVPAAAFAEYHVGAFQIPVLTTIAYSVGTAYTPLFAEMFQARRAREAIEIWRSSIGKVSLIVVPCAIVFFVAAEPFIELLFTRDYLGAAPVFRWYALLTLGRVASFGNVLVAAGQPRSVLRAACLTLLGNLAASWLGLHMFGAAGAAAGLAFAFVPMVIAYCHYIARASGLGTWQIFPLRAYLERVAMGAAAGFPAWLFVIHAELAPALRFAGAAVITLGLFASIGMLCGRLSVADFGFVALSPGQRSSWPLGSGKGNNTQP
jgi:O-antigen/teichoic acid export membrane protein